MKRKNLIVWSLAVVILVAGGALAGDKVVKGKCVFCDHSIPGVWWNT